jgi:hypothetical protein
VSVPARHPRGGARRGASVAPLALRVGWAAAVGRCECGASCSLFIYKSAGFPCMRQVITAELVAALRAVLRAGGRVNGASDGKLSSFVVLVEGGKLVVEAE